MQDTTVSVVNLIWQDTAFFVDTLPLVGPPVPHVSLFKGHELVPSSPDLTILPFPEMDNWVFLVLMLCAVLYGVAQRGGEGRPATVIKAAFDQGVANQLARNDSGQTARNLWFLLILGTLALALFTSLMLTDRFGLPYGLLPNFLISTVALTGLGLGFWLLSQMSGLLFGIPQATKAMVFERSLMMTTCGMLQLPLLVLYFYGPEELRTVCMIAGVAVLGLFYLKDVQRGVALLWAQPTVNIGHIFYYICAFKILPLSVVLRLAIAQ